MSILSFLETHQVATVLLGSTFLREGAIVPAAILSAGPAWTTDTVLIYGFIGLMLNDIGWYVIARNIPVRLTDTVFKNLLAKRPAWTRHIRSLFTLLVASNFLYGARLLVLWRAARTQPALYTLLHITTSNIIWIAVLVFAGRLAGQGIINIFPAYRTASIAIFSIFILILLVRLLQAHRRVIR